MARVNRRRRAKTRKKGYAIIAVSLYERQLRYLDDLAALCRGNRSAAVQLLIERAQTRGL